LPPAQRDGLLQRARATTEQFQKAAQIETGAIDELKAKGVTVEDCDRTVFRDRVQPDVGRFVQATPNAKKTCSTPFARPRRPDPMAEASPTGLYPSPARGPRASDSRPAECVEILAAALLVADLWWSSLRPGSASCFRRQSCGAMTSRACCCYRRHLPGGGGGVARGEKRGGGLLRRASAPTAAGAGRRDGALVILRRRRRALLVQRGAAARHVRADCGRRAAAGAVLAPMCFCGGSETVFAWTSSAASPGGPSGGTGSLPPCRVWAGWSALAPDSLPGMPGSQWVSPRRQVWSARFRSLSAGADDPRLRLGRRHAARRILRQRRRAGSTNFVLLAVPFFILVGYLMEANGMSVRIMSLLQRGVGRLRGASTFAMVLSMVVFSGNFRLEDGRRRGRGIRAGSGSAQVRAPPGDAVALLAASAVMAETIPPCVNLIILGFVTKPVDRRSLMAGLLPSASWRWP